MSRYCVCGIDPGNDGGLAFIYPLGTGYGWTTYRMPTRKVRGRKVPDLDEIRGAIEEQNTSHIILEEIRFQGAHTVMGKQSIATFFEQYGRITGYLEASPTPLLKVRPEKWKRAFPFGVNADKDAVIDYVLGAWPEIDLVASERGKKPHDGVADAVCIAWYGILHFNLKPCI